MLQQSIPVFLSLLLMSVFPFYTSAIFYYILLEILIHWAYGNYHLDSTITEEKKNCSLLSFAVILVKKKLRGGEGKTIVLVVY